MKIRSLLKYTGIVVFIIGVGLGLEGASISNRNMSYINYPLEGGYALHFACPVYSGDSLEISITSTKNVEMVVEGSTSGTVYSSLAGSFSEKMNLNSTESLNINIFNLLPESTSNFAYISGSVSIQGLTPGIYILGGIVLLFIGVILASGGYRFLRKTPSGERANKVEQFEQARACPKCAYPNSKSDTTCIRCGSPLEKVKN